MKFAERLKKSLKKMFHRKTNTNEHNDEKNKNDENKVVIQQEVYTDNAKKAKFLQFLYYWLYHVNTENEIHRKLIKKLHVLNYSDPETTTLSFTRTELVYMIAFCERWINYYQQKLLSYKITKLNNIHFEIHNHYLKQFIFLHSELLNWLTPLEKAFEENEIEMQKKKEAEKQERIKLRKEAAATVQEQKLPIQGGSMPNIAELLGGMPGMMKPGDFEGMFAGLEDQISAMGGESGAHNIANVDNNEFIQLPTEEKNIDEETETTELSSEGEEPTSNELPAKLTEKDLMDILKQLIKK